MFENIEDIDQEELNSKSDEDKIKWLLLLLLYGFNFKERFTTVFTNMLTSYTEESFHQAEKEIMELGEIHIPSDQRTEIINNIVAARLVFLLPEIEQATRNMISASVNKVKDIDALKTIISESYAVSDQRIAAIEEIEYKTIRNITRVAIAEESGIVAGVLVSDGTDHDSFCFEANGQVWSLDFAGSHILQHINCVREFTFLTQEEVEDHGGIDQE